MSMEGGESSSASTVGDHTPALAGSSTQVANLNEISAESDDGSNIPKVGKPVAEAMLLSGLPAWLTRQQKVMKGVDEVQEIFASCSRCYEIFYDKCSMLSV